MTAVLPKWYLASVGADLGLLTMCPCQWGPTGWCSSGRHEQLALAGFERHYAREHGGGR